MKYVAKNVKYATTRRGVNATAELWLGKVKIATVEDYAERIVTPVDFIKPEYRAPFVKAAHTAIPKPYAQGEGFLVSEFARKLITVSEGE